jgi:aspartyl-tRNA(Asn)/glutamyl-tRNA(Gln) amidotransferase subunit B
VPFAPGHELVGRLRSELPELPGARIRRLEPAAGLETSLGLVTTGRDGLFEAVTAAGAEPRAAANVLMNQLAAAGVDPSAVDAKELAKLIEARDRIPRAAFDEAISKAGEKGFSADPYLADETLSDAAELEPLIERILDASPGQVAAYRGGKEGLLGYFIGQVMKETGGRANPKVVDELVREKLNA